MPDSIASADCLPSVQIDAAACEETCAFLAARLQALVQAHEWDRCPFLKAARERCRRAGVELQEVINSIKKHYAARPTIQ